MKITNNVSSAFFFTLAILLGAVGLGIIFVDWQETVGVIKNGYLANSAETGRLVRELHVRRRKPPRRMVKGIYLTAYSAGSPKKMEEIISLLDRTELNTVVIDIKDYSGYVLYDSQVPLVVALALKDNRLHDLRALVRRLHDQNIYVIARQTVFQDPILAAAKPEWAMQSKRGGLWRDHKGLSWVDPTRREVWNYNLAIAKEAIRFDFDEINFDYVRFPSDGDMRDVAYANAGRKRYETMRAFYEYLGRELAMEPARISLDFFGFVMERGGEDDLQIGQRLEDALDVVDYISPMMYPSHYPRGHLGLENPAADPARVWQNGMLKGAPRFAGKKAKLRPWAQAFNLGAVYDAEKIRAQIDLAEKYSDVGWLLWNAANRYTDAGLK